jgi:hypothetical protein
VNGRREDLVVAFTLIAVGNGEIGDGLDFGHDYRSGLKIARFKQA